MKNLGRLCNIFVGRNTIACLLVVLLGLPITAHAASFEYENGSLWMEGEVDENTPGRLRRALNRYPHVRQIILAYVPGSNDDDANVETGRIIFQRRLNTIVPADGLIASGGTDLFLAGAERIVERGACIGVHAWSDDDLRSPPRELSQNDSAHNVFLDYYRDIQINAQFYWYTINIAEANDMHYMSEGEMNKYYVATVYVGDGYWDLDSCRYR